MKTLTRMLPLLLVLLPAAAGAAADGPALYRTHCAKCHGETGRAESWRGRLYFAQNFARKSFQAGRSDDDILEKINRGPRIMPAFEETLTLEERKALVQVIRGFGKAQNPEQLLSDKEAKR